MVNLPHTNDELATIEESGKAPETRMKSAKAAMAIYRRLWEEDKESAHNRARIQAMFDGEPPYRQQDLVNAGQGFRTNLNFGESEALLDDGMSAYIDLTHSNETLVSVETTFEADPEQQLKWNQILSKEISTMFRKWKGFTYNSLLNATYFLSQGVSICYWENERDWRWRVGKFGDFKIPRRTEANVDALEVAFCRRDIAPHQLYHFIAEEDAAARVGWNVDAVRKVLVDNHRSESQFAADNWEDWQERAKECDLQMSATASTIPIVHVWVQEFSGEVSHFIMLENKEASEFLFARVSRFDSMSQCFVIFTYGVGSTGNYHAIRGMGYKIFNHVQVSNRLHCQLADGALLSSSLLVQPSSQPSKDILGMTFFGPYAVLHPDLNYVPHTPPNYGQNVIPALNEFERLKRVRAGQYTSANILPERGEMTRGEVNARISSAASLSAVNTQLFYEPNDDLVTESVRRLRSPSYPESAPGGKEVHEMRRRLEAQGVPLEALYKVDLHKVRSVRAIGGGSQVRRDQIYRELLGMSGSFDPTGRNRLMRDRAASLTGNYTSVDRYLPENENARVSDDAKFAELENNHMRDMHPVQVRPNELHFDHIPVHLLLIQELIQAVDQGMPLEEAVQPLVLVHGHATTHMEFIQEEQFAQEEVAMFRQALQQAGEVIINGTRRLQKLMREGQAAGAEANGGEAGGPPSPDAQKNAELGARLERDAIEFQFKLKMMQDKHQLALQHKAEKANLDRQIENARAVSDITR